MAVLVILRRVSDYCARGSTTNNRTHVPCRAVGSMRPAWHGGDSMGILQKFKTAQNRGEDDVVDCGTASKRGLAEAARQARCTLRMDHGCFISGAATRIGSSRFPAPSPSRLLLQLAPVAPSPSSCETPAKYSRLTSMCLISCPALSKTGSGIEELVSSSLDLLRHPMTAL